MLTAREWQTGSYCITAEYLCLLVLVVRHRGSFYWVTLFRYIPAAGVVSKIEPYLKRPQEDHFTAVYFMRIETTPT